MRYEVLQITDATPPGFPSRPRFDADPDPAPPMPPRQGQRYRVLVVIGDDPPPGWIRDYIRHDR